VRLATDVLALTVDPGRGGSLVEWDYRPVPRHLGNVLTRRRESYHADLLKAVAAGTLRSAATEGVESIHTSAVRVKHPGLERHLVYDRTRRPSLRIRLVPQGTTLDQLRRDGQDDLGGLPSDAHTWELDVEAGRAAVHLRREAQIGSGRIAVERTIEAGAGSHGLGHGIRMRWEGAASLRAVLAEEWALGVFGSPEDVWAEGAGRRLSLYEPGTLPEARRVTITEGWSGLVLTFDLSIPAAVSCFPLFTISNSEGGFEQNFQGAVLLHSWSLDLAPGDAWQESTRCQITFQRR